MSRTTTVFGIQTAAVEAQASTYLHQRGVRLGLEFVRGVNALIKQVRARAAPVLVVCVRERVSYPWLIRHSRGIQPDEQARHVCPVVQQELLSGAQKCRTNSMQHGWAGALCGMGFWGQTITNTFDRPTSASVFLCPSKANVGGHSPSPR